MAMRARLLTKTQLRSERLKPAKGQLPATEYWQGRGWVNLYDPGAAKPMRAYRAPTATQLASLSSGRKLVGTAPCASCGARIDRQLLNRRGLCDKCMAEALDRELRARHASACAHAAQLLACDPLFLDTETTGLDGEAEIIEIAVLDRHGQVLLESLVRPVCPVPPEVSAIHGLKDADLLDAPTWPALADSLTQLLAGRTVVAHSASFDERLIEQSCRRHGLIAPVVASWECSLELTAGIEGVRRPALAVAMRLAGAEPPDPSRGHPHRAVYDADCCRRVVAALAAHHVQSSPRA
jgi:DNA polymerase-3 subunit epsilon